MVKDTASHGWVPLVQGLLTSLQAKLRSVVLSVEVTGLEDCHYLGTHLGLHLVGLLGDTLLAEEVSHKVLGTSSALIAGDGTSSSSYSSKDNKEGLHCLLFRGE